MIKKQDPAAESEAQWELDQARWSNFKFQTSKGNEFFLRLRKLFSELKTWATNNSNISLEGVPETATAFIQDLGKLEEMVFVVKTE